MRLRNAAAETTCAINELAGFTDRSTWPSAPLNDAQVCAQKLIHDLHYQRSWPPGSVVRPRAALKKLLRQSPAYGGATGSLAPYLDGMVSIPSDQGDPCVLSEILDPVNRHLLENFESLMMPSQDQRDHVVEDTLNGSESYMDPTLKSDPRAWASFVHQLYKANVIIFISDPRVQIGAFFVLTNNGKLRFIADARRANRLFRRPPKTILGSIESWSRLDLHSDLDGHELDDAELFVAQEDVKDFFFRLAIARALSRFFAFQEVDPELLREEFGGNLPPDVQSLVDAGLPLHPAMGVLPMRFS